MARCKDFRQSSLGPFWMLIPAAVVGWFLACRGPWSTAQGQPVISSTPATVEPFPLPPELQGVDLLRQTAEEAAGKSTGCVVCHIGSHDPHEKATVHLGCVDCHGGDPTSAVKEQAHVRPRF